MNVTYGMDRCETFLEIQSVRKHNLRIRFILQFRIFSNIYTVDLVQTLVSTLIFRKLYLVRFLFLTKYLLLLKVKRLCFSDSSICSTCY